jgi:hypothetical protein
MRLTGRFFEDVGYEKAKVTHLASAGRYLFCTGGRDGSRDFYVRVSATEMKPIEIMKLKA